MVQLVNNDLRYVYNLKKGYKVFLGYDTELNSNAKVTLHFSSRRKMDFYVKPKSDIQVIIYSKTDNVYIVDSVKFNEKGIGNVDDVLKKHGIPFEPVSSEGWQNFKRSSWIQSYIFVSDKGFYMWKHLWLDIDVWNIDMYSKDGVAISGGDTIKETHFEKIGGSIQNGHYAFLDKMITKGCSLKEYESFKEKYVNTGADIKYKEVK